MRELVILAGLAAAVAVSQALHARRLRSLRRRLEARLDELGAHVFQAKTSASAAVYELQQLNAAAQRLRSRARSSDAPPRREVAEGLLQRVELLSTKLGAIEGTNQRLLLEAREAAAILAKIDERTSDPGEGED